MPQPPDGTIFWSAAAQNFYKIGQAGAIPRLEGLASLEARFYPSGVRFYDALGNRTPNPENLLTQSDYQRLVLEGQTMRSTSKDWQSVTPGESSFYRALFTYVDENGKTQLGWSNFAINRTVDPEVLKGRTIRSVGNKRGIATDSPEGGSSKIAELVSSSWMTVVSE